MTGPSTDPTPGQPPPTGPDAPAAPDTPTADTPAAGPARRGPRRFWAGRRVPAFLVALVTLAGAGALLYDTVAVHGLDRRAGRWRRELTDELATRQFDDTVVLAGSGAVALLGLWLLWLALTPGLRAVLPMDTPTARLRAGLDRRAAALVLRDSAQRVSGVRAVRVHVRRRRVRVRADVHFRDREEVRSELDALLRAELADLGLARPPRLSLTLREVTAG